MSKRLNLKRARQHRPAQPAHTAAGRDILGAWGWFERIVLLATFASILLASVAFWIDYRDRIEARRVNAATLAEIAASQITRRDEAIARAWSILTTPATGNSGKREAMEYLASQGVSLRGVDLSCERMGGHWIDRYGVVECQGAVDLTGLRLSAPGDGPSDLSSANLAGADLTSARFPLGSELSNADLSHSHLMGAQLSGTALSGSNLRNADLVGTHLVETYLVGANLSRAAFYGADLTGAFLSNAQISQTHFDENTTILSSVAFDRVWAWADQPPDFLPDGVDLRLCRFVEDSHDRDQRPDPCLPPLN
ncbi:MAG: pentapeptide repeat-containing protein [Rhodobacter sp.]|nr:pentapeptide repeat-containing protein [Rhodobacter sp.]